MTVSFFCHLPLSPSLSMNPSWNPADDAVFYFLANLIIYLLMHLPLAQIALLLFLEIGMFSY